MNYIISPRSEAERIINTLIVIMSGFYEKHGFVVVSELMDGVDSESQVVLPKLDYKSVEGLWEELKERKSEIPTKIGDAWVEKVSRLIDYNVMEKPLEQKREAMWEQIQDKFWIEVEKFSPGSRKLVGEVEIRTTKYGTTCTASWMKGQVGQKMYFYLRTDRGVEDVAGMMINQILHTQKEELGITWSKREALMDFIMTRPNMKKLFPQFHPVINQLLRVPAKVRKESEKYLRELELSREKTEFEFEKTKLSVIEKKVMKVFVERQGELVSYDELADVVWGIGEFKTFWAINKLVERMRIKLGKIGFDGSRVESVRGQGYLLK